MTNSKKLVLKPFKVNVHDYKYVKKQERLERREHLRFDKNIHSRYPNKIHFDLRLFSTEKKYKLNSSLNAFASFPSEPYVFHCQILDEDKGYCGYIYDASIETRTTCNRNAALKAHLHKHLESSNDEVIMENMNTFMAPQLLSAIKEFKNPDAMQQHEKERKEENEKIIKASLFTFVINSCVPSKSLDTKVLQQMFSRVGVDANLRGLTQQLTRWMLEGKEEVKLRLKENSQK